MRLLSLTDYPSRLSKISTHDQTFALGHVVPPHGIPDDVLKTASGISWRSGADGDRTHGLRLAKPALSQLSYSPSKAASLRRSTRGAEGRPDTPYRGASGLPSHVPASRRAGSAIGPVWILSPSLRKRIADSAAPS